MHKSWWELRRPVWMLRARSVCSMFTSCGRRRSSFARERDSEALSWRRGIWWFCWAFYLRCAIELGTSKFRNLTSVQLVERNGSSLQMQASRREHMHPIRRRWCNEKPLSTGAVYVRGDQGQFRNSQLERNPWILLRMGWIVFCLIIQKGRQLVLLESVGEGTDLWVSWKFRDRSSSLDTVLLWNSLPMRFPVYQHIDYHETTKRKVVAIQSNRPGHLLLRLVEFYCLRHWHCIRSEASVDRSEMMLHVAFKLGCSKLASHPSTTASFSVSMSYLLSSTIGQRGNLSKSRNGFLWAFLLLDWAWRLLWSRSQVQTGDGATLALLLLPILGGLALSSSLSRLHLVFLRWRCLRWFS